ncbi:MAG: Gfo/Idh/MocA family oxidoreductase [Acidobacteria bacterium]|nr:Gfo/Idh/MocA family oxidoreductase [Acidobacteriota bacterium]MCA1607862.1 Gfo/Idh/MocA family oxidoreductase [Acidobacteriota bacterium]
MKETVGVGFIGTGFARKVQMPSFAACKNSRLVSVASFSLENAKATAAEFGIAHFTDDWTRTISHPEVELVCITTPPNLHKEMTLGALRAGKHVLCEKPMARNVAEAEEMLTESRSAGVLALIDHELRFQPGRQAAYGLLREKAIGTIRHAKYNFRAPHRGDPNLAWNWWSDAEQGGGALGAINSHVIDSFHWLLDADIESVYCQLQTHVKQRPLDGGLRDVTTDDEANMLLHFHDSDIVSNATGLVSVSMVEQPNYQNRIELFGTDGAMRVDHRGELFLAKADENEWTSVDIDLGNAIEGVADTGFSRAFAAFAPKLVEAVRKGERSIENAATFQDGLRIQNVLDAARKSNEDGKLKKVS